MAIFKTLDDIINHNDRFDVNKISFFAQTDDKTLIVPDKNLLEIYYRFVLPYVGVYDLRPAERRHYRYKPYLLSQDVYNTPALGWMILKMNDRECASKFYLKQTVRLIPATVLGDIYESISTKSTAQLTANWNKYLTQVGQELD